MAFTVGQKVVCVDAREPEDGWDGDALVKGQIYTVRRPNGRNGVILYEATRSPKTLLFYGGNSGYLSRRFRPLVSRKTDISIFHEILDRVNSGETELVE